MLSPPMSDVLKLLMVDDCPEDREVYRDYLLDDPHFSYEFLEAAKAEVGLSILAKEQCDVVLLDFYMPDMTGLEFLSELAHIQQSPVPIIMLTGQGDETVAVQAMKQGVQDYLPKKTLQPEILQLAIRNVVKQASLETLLQKTQDRQRLIATTALRIRQSLSLDYILDTAVAEVQQLLECDRVAVYQCLSGQACQILAELGQATADLNWVQALVTEASQNDQMLHSEQGTLAVPILLPAQTNQAPNIWGYFVVEKQASGQQWLPEEEAMLGELALQLTTAIQQAELLTHTQAALKKAEELTAFKSQIIATVSHEYRSPLAAILAAATTLNQSSEGLTPEQQRRYLRLIQDRARHMARLVDDMLLVHQCDLDKAKFAPQSLNLLQFVSDLVEEHREMIQAEHELVFKIAGKTTGFHGDQGLLRMALGNLLSNAIKYSPDGGAITVELLGQSDTVTIKVTDQGIGIPQADYKTIFQSLGRARNVETIPGTGLGLAIAKTCIDLHSGTITLESQEGEGTTFVIQLPKQPSLYKASEAQVSYKAKP